MRGSKYYVPKFCSVVKVMTNDMIALTPLRSTWILEVSLSCDLPPSDD